MTKTVLGWAGADEDTVSLDAEARSRGTYIVGSTGMGKTTLLQSIAYQDMQAGHGVCVLDPHGDMIDWLLERVPAEREEDVILFNPADYQRPFGMNLLACDQKNPQEVRWVVSTIMATLRRLFEWTWGPHLEHVLGHTLWTVMTIPNATLIEVLLLLTDDSFRKHWVKKLDNKLLKNFWADFPKPGRSRLEFISSTVNKLTPFLLDTGMRHIVSQAHNTFDMRKVMDDQKILLVNLSKGDLGENNSSLLGSVIINLILMTALRRRDKTYEERQLHPFHVIVDEYQNFASDSFSVLQSEARKYAVDLVVAHQFRDQLTEENRGSALNVGNYVFFRTTGIDGPELASQFDNTPPPPQKLRQPIVKPTQRDPNVLRPDKNHYEEIDGPQRLYSDMMMERANELTNLSPYHFKARLIAPDPESSTGQLVLMEHSLTTVNPKAKDEKIGQQAQKVYGQADPERAKRIRERSRDMAPTEAEVAAEVQRRTLNRVRSEAPTIAEVTASEIVEGSELDWLLFSELDRVMVEEDAST